VPEAQPAAHGSRQDPLTAAAAAATADRAELLRGSSDMMPLEQHQRHPPHQPQPQQRRTPVILDNPAAAGRSEHQGISISSSSAASSSRSAGGAGRVRTADEIRQAYGRPALRPANQVREGPGGDTEADEAIHTAGAAQH
jgi:hypothetical protein